VKIVAIAGMIGSGKTTLTKGLAQLTGWPTIYEEVHQNPFFRHFYEDIERWALASQLSFMLDKTQAFENCSKVSNGVILVDRTIDEDFFVFGSVLLRFGKISDAEHQLLERYYDVLKRSWPSIDLYIYLEDSDEACFQRILDRGDALESKMELGYLKSIGAEYRQWKQNILRTPHYEISSAKVDFRRPENVEKVLKNVLSLL